VPHSKGGPRNSVVGSTAVASAPMEHTRQKTDQVINMGNVRCSWGRFLEELIFVLRSSW
jgi:hypothetical protein